MRAAVYERYGGLEVLDVREVPRPPGPRAGEVRVRVHAAALNPKDVLERKGKYRLFTGRRFPRGVGYDFAGEVLALGPGVMSLQVGERVWGMVNGWRACTCAEEVVVTPEECGPAPARLPDASAAAVPLAALTALQALRDKGRVREGSRVCINGASGGVGTFALQVARVLGARVTSVSSGRNVELCRQLGAHEALDYARERPQERRAAFDVFFDVFGNVGPRAARRSLVRGGTFVATVPSPEVFAAVALQPLTGVRVRPVVVRSRRADLDLLRRWVEEGRLAPVVEHVFALPAIREAQAQVETRRTRGKVVVQVA